MFFLSFASFGALTQCQQLIAILARFIMNSRSRANPSTSRVLQIALSSMQKLELDTQRSLELNIHIENHSKYVRLSTFVMGVFVFPSCSLFLFIQQNIQTLFALAYIEHWCLLVVPPHTLYTLPPSIVIVFFVYTNAYKKQKRNSSKLRCTKGKHV